MQTNINSSIRTDKAMALIEALFFFVLFVIIDLVFFTPHLQSLYPINDEFSLISESQVLSLKWLTEGYSNYFSAYPEFFVPFTNFIRPVANLIYWLFSPWSEQGYKIQLIITGYMVQSAIAAIFYFFNRVTLSNTRLFSFTVALVAFLAPAFWCNLMPFYPAYSLDGIAALFCLAGMLLLLTRYVWLGVLFFLFAVFTKETALPVVAAAVMFGFFTRNRQVAALSSGVIGIWLVIMGISSYLIAQHLGHTSGVYIFSQGHYFQRFVHILQIPFSYSTGTFNDTPLVLFLFIYMNFLLWTVFSFMVWRFYVDHLKSKLLARFHFVIQDDRSRAFLLFVLATIASALFFAFIAGTVRFAYVFTICFLGAVSAARPMGYARSCVLAALLIPAVVTDIEVLNLQMSTTPKLQVSRDLVAKLKEVGNVEGAVYDINDFVGGFSRRDNIASFAGVTTKLVGGSSINFSMCNPGEFSRASVSVQQLGKNLKIFTVKIPACAKFFFEGASEGSGTHSLYSRISGQTLSRNDHISYDFPLFDVQKSLQKNPYGMPDFGTTQIIKVRDAHVIYYDFAGKQWIYLQ